MSFVLTARNIVVQLKFCIPCILFYPQVWVMYVLTKLHFIKVPRWKRYFHSFMDVLLAATPKVFHMHYWHYVCVSESFPEISVQAVRWLLWYCILPVNSHGFYKFQLEILHMYQFLRDVIFDVFVAIREIFILEISLANFDLHESESRILGDPRK